MLQKVSKLAEMAIPMIGMGTRGLQGQPCRRLLKQGVNFGVSLIDTNPIFKNDSMIGEVFKSFKREKVFLINKVPACSMNFREAVDVIEKSLKNVKTDYFDLVLIESPAIQGRKEQHRLHARARCETWKALMKLKGEGKAKHIGVAGFNVNHLEQIWDKFDVKPEANMIEFHPWAFDSQAFQFHLEKKVQIIASCPLARANRELYSNPLLIELKKKYKRSRAQILLRWAHQKGVVIIPKAGNIKHLEENLKLGFEIESLDVDSLDSLASGRKVGWITDKIK
jgi:diketogulonate reductase-like aldo/keto reductase